MLVEEDSEAGDVEEDAKLEIDEDMDEEEDELVWELVCELVVVVVLRTAISWSSSDCADAKAKRPSMDKRSIVFLDRRRVCE